jgi:hypothetical protein
MLSLTCGYAGALGATRTPDLLTLRCMSRVYGKIHRLGELTVELAGDTALKAATGLPDGLSLGGGEGDVGLCTRAAAHPDQRDVVNGVVRARGGAGAALDPYTLLSAVPRICPARVTGRRGSRSADRSFPGQGAPSHASAKARKNYAGTSPVTRASGKKKTVLARYVHNDRLIDALHQQAFCALTASPGARAYYDELRARGQGHHAALRQLSNRLVGILHGCLKTGALYDEHTAWGTTTKINKLPLDKLSPYTPGSGVTPLVMSQRNGTTRLSATHSRPAGPRRSLQRIPTTGSPGSERTAALAQPATCFPTAQGL